MLVDTHWVTLMFKAIWLGRSIKGSEHFSLPEEWIMFKFFETANQSGTLIKLLWAKQLTNSISHNSISYTYDVNTWISYIRTAKSNESVWSSGLRWINSNPDLCNANAVLYQLSHETNWELVFIWVDNKPINDGSRLYIYIFL